MELGRTGVGDECQLAFGPINITGNMINGLGHLLEGSGHAGLAELRELLEDLLGGREVTGRVIGQENMKARSSRVHRLRFTVNGAVRSLVVKRLEPGIARRNELVATRWLPAIGLRESGSTLLGSAAERRAQCV